MDESEEILEGLQSGKYKLESLTVDRIKDKYQKEKFAYSIMDGLLKRKEAQFNKKTVCDIKGNPTDHEKIKIYFVLKAVEADDRSMTAKEYLSQYRDAVKDIRAKRDELAKLIEDATAVSPSASAGHTAGNVSDKVGRKAAAAADLEREIEEECAALRTLRRDIRATIHTVRSGDLRRLLTYRYICGCTWERVAVKMGMSYVHVVHRLHPRALKAVGDTLSQVGAVSKTVDKESTVYISREAVDEINSIPNADVAPVIHAYWKRVQAAHNTFRCSKCGHIRELNHFGERIATPKLCEMCGAHMNGKPTESEDISV